MDARALSCLLFTPEEVKFPILISPLAKWNAKLQWKTVVTWINQTKSEIYF